MASGQDVDRHAAREQAGDGGEQSHRQDPDDGQRQLPAFVLRDENQEDKERGGAEDEEGRRAAQLLLEREVGPSNVMPFGSTSLANSSMRCNAVPVATPGAAPPCTSAAGNRL